MNQRLAALEPRSRPHPERHLESALPESLDAWPLALRGLHKHWPKAPRPVLDGLHLTLRPRTCTWVGGRNGVGKTTMLRVAAGLIDADRGTTSAWGLTPGLGRARYQRLVSFLPAGDRGLYARLTVRQQLEFCARLALIDSRQLAAQIERSIQEFALTELADRRVDRMSMGQRQRLRLALTFLPAPEIVLLDEPLTSLDGEGSEMLVEQIRRVLDRDGAVLWCSPDSEDHRVEFDERWLLHDGALVPA